MVAFAPWEAKSRAMSTMGIRWPGDMKGKKNTWSGLDCAVDAIDQRKRKRIVVFRGELVTSAICNI
jgi:hypothetical protein